MPEIMPMLQMENLELREVVKYPDLIVHRWQEPGCNLDFKLHALVFHLDSCLSVAGTTIKIEDEDFYF